MEAAHITAGARASLPLVRDDEDRQELLALVSAGLGALLLAYCIMDTHLHVVAEGPGEHVRRWLDQALTTYVRAFNRRHGARGWLLRGPPEATVPIDAFELARTIRYVHENPVKAGMVDHAFEFPWSSQRAFAGLTLARSANVERACAMVGGGQGAPAGGSQALIGRLRGVSVALADLEPAAVPSATPGILLAAAAETYGVSAMALAGPCRDEALTLTRALFLALGRLESYSLAQLGPFLARKRSQLYRLTESSVPDDALRIARTLLRTPGLRRRLPRVGAGEVAA